MVRTVSSRRVGLMALVCAALVAATFRLGAGSAGADTFVRLPNGSNSMATAIGIKVDLRRTAESATISPALSANGMTRTAWVSGTDYATAPGATTGSLESGYLVGCQVDLSDGLSAGVDMWLSAPPLFYAPELSNAFNIKPGQVADVKLGTKKLAPKQSAVGFSYRNLGIQVDGCGGFAEARSYALLTVGNASGSTVVTLYGAPFGLG